MITFGGQKYDIPQEYVLSLLKEMDHPLAEALANKNSLELPKDFYAEDGDGDNGGESCGRVSAKEEQIARAEAFIERRLRVYSRGLSLRESKLAASLESDSGQEPAGAPFVYIVTNYERGDDRSAFCYGTTDSASLCRRGAPKMDARLGDARAFVALRPKPLGRRKNSLGRLQRSKRQVDCGLQR